MTKMIESLAQRPAATRVPIAILLGTLGLFLIGLTAGIAAASIEQGHLPSRLWVLGLAILAVPLGLIALRVAWQLLLPPASASGYERRYWRMLVGVGALGVPIGMVAVITSKDKGFGALNPFVSSALSPGVAITLASLSAIAFIVAVALYHRAIDDHEQQAYLWGSQVAYYFLIVAFPVWWFLQRGGLIPAMNVGTVIVALLLSFIVQAAVWAWLKYR